MLQKYASVKWVNNDYALKLLETFNSCNFLMGTNFCLRQLHSERGQRDLISNNFD